MGVWRCNTNGEKEFVGGLENWLLAAQTADECRFFIPDDEDEQISDDPKSCYDCRYRRWMMNTIVCMAKD